MALYKYSTSLTPSKDLQAQFQQALSYQQRGMPERARPIYEDILRIQPSHADALHLLGVIELHSGGPERAIELIGRSISLQPNNAACYLNLGNAYKALQMFEDALANYDMAIAIKRDYPQAYSNKGVVLQRLQQWDAALACFDKAIDISPGNVEAHFNRGNTLKDMRQFDAAITSYNRALEILPGFAEAHLNCGSALFELARFDAALLHLERAIEHMPGYAQALWNKSLVSLLLGDFATGWRLHEMRWKIDGAAPDQRRYSQPLWLGDASLEGKTILLYGEQGLGDTIQFCRYVKFFSTLRTRVVLQVQAALLEILETLEGVDTLISSDDEAPAFDFHCPLLSLPLAFNTNLETIPYSKAFLRSTPSKVAQWSAKLGLKANTRIGISWRGNREHFNDHNRSIALSTFVMHMPDGFEYISLQKDVTLEDKHTLENHPSIRHFGEDIRDFADTAALCELLDLVICVDTSVAHLSGAMGKTTWILLPHVPDWRWMLERNDSPWYPSVRLFRQPTLGDWATVFKEIRLSLAELPINVI